MRSNNSKIGQMTVKIGQMTVKGCFMRSNDSKIGWNNSKRTLYEVE